jgi:hypothetical protein
MMTFIESCIDIGKACLTASLSDRLSGTKARIALILTIAFLPIGLGGLLWYRQAAPPATSALPAAAPASSGPATANGDNSVANSGTIGTVNLNSQPKSAGNGK